MKIKKNLSTAQWSILIFACLYFLWEVFPFLFERMVGGRNAEKLAVTAGMIRMYCHDSSLGLLKAPQIFFGNNPFNLEFPLYEWVLGHLSRLVSGGQCMLQVERSAQIANMIIALIGACFSGLLAELISSRFIQNKKTSLHIALVLGVMILLFDYLWLQYSTYVMIETFVITCAIAAVYFSLKNRPVLATIFWTLTIVQKLQFFIFFGTFWFFIELALKPSKKRVQQFFAVMAVVFIFEASWVAWSTQINRYSDNPWHIHTGKRILKWYFGTLDQRLHLKYYTDLLVNTFKRLNLHVFLPFVLFLGFQSHRFKKHKKDFQNYFQKTAVLYGSFLAGYFLLTVSFFPVFFAHEYYALPLNAMRAIGTAVAAALVFNLVESINLSEKHKNVFSALCVVILISFVMPNISRFRDYKSKINTVSDSGFMKDWNIQRFPEEHVLVAMVMPSGGDKYLPLYFTRQKGFMWCTENPANAPRAYWKQQGVKYVAWYAGEDFTGNTGTRWRIRTIEEELAEARQKGWSSDIFDVWAQRPMYEWAWHASEYEKNPCLKKEDFDPRVW